MSFLGGKTVKLPQEDERLKEANRLRLQALAAGSKGRQSTILTRGSGGGVGLGDVSPITSSPMIGGQ